jgi:hypothetical protein
LRNEKTQKEAQHLLAFSLYHSGSTVGSIISGFLSVWHYDDFVFELLLARGTMLCFECFNFQANTPLPPMRFSSQSSLAITRTGKLWWNCAAIIQTSNFEL